MHKSLMITVAAAMLLFSGQVIAQTQTLQVWWVKGFYKAEDAALSEAIQKYESKTGVKVELSLSAAQDIVPKTMAAMDADALPDVAYADIYDFQAASKWAYEGQLEDLSDVLEPMKARFLPNTLETALLYNNKDKKRAYYAFPLRQQTMHVQYWNDLLEQAGFKASDIPKDWKGYWAFWCDKVQPNFRQATKTRGFSVGQPMGVDSTDAYYSFLTFADAYNVKLVDDDGKLLVDDPKVRAGLISAMTDYTDIYTKGCTPPSSTNWKDQDNNVAFHNRTVVMTHNATISIAAKWLDDMNNMTLTEDQRALAKKYYTQSIHTAGFPNKPDGSVMQYRTAVKVGVIFAQSKNKALGKDFIRYFMQEENLKPYVEGALGRWFPVTKSGQESPFWRADPHRKSVLDQYADGTVTFEFTKNWKFTLMNNENVWAKAMNRVASEKIPVDKAVDEMIARMKAIDASAE